MVRKVILIAAVVLILTVSLVGTAFAADPHGGSPGQPNQSCEVTTTTPGQAASAPGSAFNPSGTAGGVYAGEQPQNSNNTHSVSQYDVACFQVTP